MGISENFYSTSLIYIYDRFGKLLFNMEATGEGWNGFYNGNLLPSSDYWFSVLLTDKKGITREKKGHFSLIIR
jgi:gliding motility-associated-like protein